MPRQRFVILGRSVRSSLRTVLLRMLLAVFVLDALVYPTNAYADNETARKLLMACAVAFGNLGKAQAQEPAKVEAPAPVVQAAAKAASPEEKAVTPPAVVAKTETKDSQKVIPPSTEAAALQARAESILKDMADTDQAKRDAAVAKAEDALKALRTAENPKPEGDNSRSRDLYKWLTKDTLSSRLLWIGTAAAGVLLTRGMYRVAKRRGLAAKDWNALLKIEEALRNDDLEFSHKRDDMVMALAEQPPEVRQVLVDRLDELDAELMGRMQLLITDGVAKEPGTNVDLAELGDALLEQYAKYYAAIEAQGENLTVRTGRMTGNTRSKPISPETIAQNAREVSGAERAFYILKATTEGIATVRREMAFLFEQNRKVLGKLSPQEKEQIASMRWASDDVVWASRWITYAAKKMVGTRAAQRVTDAMAFKRTRTRDEIRSSLEGKPAPHYGKVKQALILFATGEFRLNPLRQRNLSPAFMFLVKGAFLGAIALGPAIMSASDRDSREAEQQVAYIQAAEQQVFNDSLIEEAYWQLAYADVLNRAKQAWAASPQLNKDFTLSIDRMEAGVPHDFIADIKFWVMHAMMEQVAKHPEQKGEALMNSEAYYISVARQILNSIHSDASTLKADSPEKFEQLVKELGHHMYHAYDFPFSDQDYVNNYLAALHNRMGVILKQMKAEYEAVNGAGTFVEPDQAELERRMRMPLPPKPEPAPAAAPAAGAPAAAPTTPGQPEAAAPTPAAAQPAAAQPMAPNPAAAPKNPAAEEDPADAAMDDEMAGDAVDADDVELPQ